VNIKIGLNWLGSGKKDLCPALFHIGVIANEWLSSPSVLFLLIISHSI